MSDVIQETPQEFWRPQLAQAQSPAGLVEVCDECSTEFIAGARFCHVCGAGRQVASPASAEASWARAFEFLKVLEFHSVKEWLALSTASLIAFLAGVGCILAAIAVGLIYSAQNLADFQAIQLWRMQWLLGAIAAFVAAILLKRSDSTQN